MIRWFRIRCLLISLALASSALAVDTQHAQITALTGKVEVSRREASWEPLKEGDLVGVGDRLHSGWKATCTLLFPDGSLMQVQPMSLIEMDKLAVDGPFTRNKVLLKLGAVEVQVNRQRTTASDFRVQTPTTTASVRGTHINRISYDEGSGTQIRMGDHGLLAVLTPRGRVFLRANRSTGLRQTGDRLLTPAEWDRSLAAVDIIPDGATQTELDDVRGLGVPKAAARGDGGSDLANRLGRLPDYQTVFVPPETRQVIKDGTSPGRLKTGGN